MSPISMKLFKDMSFTLIKIISKLHAKVAEGDVNHKHMSALLDQLAVQAGMHEGTNQCIKQIDRSIHTLFDDQARSNEKSEEVADMMAQLSSRFAIHRTGAENDKHS